MNLFINDNFFHTVDRKVNVLQLIRQVAEDDEVILREVLEALLEMYGYTTPELLEEEILDGAVDDVTIFDDTLYAKGDALREIFDSLFPGDYTQVISNLNDQLLNSTETTLRLDHNCVPVLPEVQPDLPFPAEDLVSDETEVSAVHTEVDVLSSDAFLGQLVFNGKVIPVREVTGKNGVLFDVCRLYNAVYGQGNNLDYVQQLLVERRLVIDPEDVLCINNTIYLTQFALAKLHDRLTYQSEWRPLAEQIVSQFVASPYQDMKFDLLGNRVG